MVSLSQTSPPSFAAAPAAVAVLVKDQGWRAALPRPEALARKAAAAALADPALRAKVAATGVSVSLCFAGDAEVRRLNRDFRAKDAPTNVLAFPSGEDSFLGDVVLALGAVRAEAKAQGKSVADHAAHLIVHGCLHLAGFTHDEDRGAAAMERLEVRILKGLGIADPYRAKAV